ncbi:MAG: SurA N-terminal domain-containing protein [Nitrospirae bacterium]|nr:SurA N-terminal domain-containing protein [Nitrospirota bacterium]
MSRGWGGLVGLLFFFLFFPGFFAEAALLDRVLAAVDGEIITLTDVRIALQFKLVNLREPAADPESPENLKAALSRLIDRKLLLAEARKFSITPEGLSEEEISGEIRKVRDLLPPETYPATLKRFGITEDDLIRRVREKGAEEKFLNFRIGFFVILSPDAIRKYYQDHAAEYGERPFEEVQGEIETLLTRRESDRLLEEYLTRLRGQATIQVNPL